MESEQGGWRSLKKLHVYCVPFTMFPLPSGVSKILFEPAAGFFNHKHCRNELFLLCTEELRLHCFRIRKSQTQALEYQEKFRRQIGQISLYFVIYVLEF